MIRLSFSTNYPPTRYSIAFIFLPFLIHKPSSVLSLFLLFFHQPKCFLFFGFFSPYFRKICIIFFDVKGVLFSLQSFLTSHYVMIFRLFVLLMTDANPSTKFLMLFVIFYSRTHSLCKFCSICCMDTAGQTQSFVRIFLRLKFTIFYSY